MNKVYYQVSLSVWLLKSIDRNLPFIPFVRQVGLVEVVDVSGSLLLVCHGLAQVGVGVGSQCNIVSPQVKGGPAG
jgi:hypothetical protein